MYFFPKCFYYYLLSMTVFKFVIYNTSNLQEHICPTCSPQMDFLYSFYGVLFTVSDKGFIKSGVCFFKILFFLFLYNPVYL